MHRTRYDIIDSMLRVATHGARISHLVYQSNLNFKLVKNYLAELLGKALLKQVGSFYVTTDKGSQFIEKFDLMLNVLQ